MNRREFLRLLTSTSLVANGDLFGYSQTAPPDVELALTASPGEVNLLPGRPTQVWRFSANVLRGDATTLQTIENSYLGPVIRVRRGQRIRVRFRNQLGEPSIVHWHGLDVPETADGHPRLAVGDHGEYVYDFPVINRAGTYWYHPHPHQRTAAQTYRGMAGLFLVSDPEEDALGLPAGSGELLFVLQDRLFDTANQLVYVGAGRDGGMGRGRGMMRGGGMMQMMEAANGWLGDRVLVNGRVQPSMTVDRRTYRLRLLNGSNARFYKLAWSDGTAINVIGGDGGLLEHPITLRSLTLAPGQRADTLLDLSNRAAGSELRLESLEFPEDAVGSAGMMMGGSSPAPQGTPFILATLRVSTIQGPRYSVPAQLSTHTIASGSAPPVRRIPLTFMRMNWVIDGRVFDMHDVAGVETVAPGSTHIWELISQPNPMGFAMAHPIHLHGRQFKVVSRSGGSANALREGITDAGWTDTVVVLPGQTVRIQVTFSKYPGLYLYHCHILEHEDMGMMRNFRIHG